MKCEYQDGWKVDYSGSLRINKGDEINVFIKEGFVSDEIDSALHQAEAAHSCAYLRGVAESITHTVGKKACIHE